VTVTHLYRDREQGRVADSDSLGLLLKGLELASQELDDAEVQVTNAVIDARSAGANWTQVGAAIGIDRVTASKRYKGIARDEIPKERRRH
jgi:hypothetical protein